VKYSDFILRFESESDTDFSVVVQESPAGMGRAVFRLPLSFEEVDEALPSLWRDLVLATHRLPRSESLRRVGEELYRALFGGIVGDLFDRSFGIVQADGDSGLRIKIVIDPKNHRASRLQALPWEYLCNPNTRGFLALNRLTPIVRYWEVNRPSLIPPQGPIFRVLLVAPDFPQFPKLDLDKECQAIIAALQPIKGVEVLLLNSPTLSSLRTMLLRQPIHALHFSGTARFDPGKQEGEIFFADEAGDPLGVTGESLAMLLRDINPLRLIFINSCDTGRVAGEAARNPFRGVATTLVNEGFPAVIGMQFPISDRAAITFSSSFYERIAAGDSIEEAITEARQNVYMSDAEGFEWSTPVLFSRLPAGLLFGPADESVSVDRLKIFLCHSSRDKPQVRELYRRLKAEGFEVWLDEVNILPGMKWKEEIAAAMRRSSVIIICLSQGAVSKAGYVQREIKMALDLLDEQPERSTFVIPVRFEECEVPERLRDIHYVDLSADGAYDRLIMSLRQRAREVGLSS
jgi:hypothetical protein